jgi:hypothetical protein
MMIEFEKTTTRRFILIQYANHFAMNVTNRILKTNMIHPSFRQFMVARFTFVVVENMIKQERNDKRK